MIITKTKLGLYIIKPDIFKDSRGYFLESWNKNKYEELGIDFNFFQDSISYSSKRGVLRGLHFQDKYAAQGKLIQVLQGKIFDLAVNINPNSPYFGHYESIILDNKTQVFIPPLFAHGFQVLSKNALVSYKSTNYYNKGLERTIIYNDKDINIKWPIKNPTISDKDKRGITLKQYINDN